MVVCTTAPATNMSSPVVVNCLGGVRGCDNTAVSHVFMVGRRKNFIIRDTLLLLTRGIISPKMFP